MKHSKPFTILPNQVLKDKRLTHTDKILYWAISSFAYGTKDIAYPGNDALFELIGILSQHISKHTTKLRDCGYIEILFDKRTARGYPKIKYKLLPMPPKPSQSGETPATTSVATQSESNNSPNIQSPTASVTEQRIDPEQTVATITNSTSNSSISRGSQESIGIVVQPEMPDAEAIPGSKKSPSNTGRNKETPHGNYKQDSITADALFASAVSDTTSGSDSDQQGPVDSFFAGAKNESDESATRRSLNSFEEGHSGDISSGAGTAQGASYLGLRIPVTSTPTVGESTSQHSNANARDVSSAYSQSDFKRMLESGGKIISCGDADQLISMPWFLLMGFNLYAPDSDVSDVQKVIPHIMQIGEDLIRMIFKKKDMCTLDDFVNEYGQLLKTAFNGSLNHWTAGAAPSIESFANHIKRIRTLRTASLREAKHRSAHWAAPRFGRDH